MQETLTELKLALFNLVTGCGLDLEDNEYAGEDLVGLHRQMGRILGQAFPATSHLASPPMRPSPRHVPAMSRVSEPARFNNQDQAVTTEMAW